MRKTQKALMIDERFRRTLVGLKLDIDGDETLTIQTVSDEPLWG